MNNELNWKIAALTLSVRYETAWLKLQKALRDVGDALREEKYRADQLFQGSRCRTGKPVPLFLIALQGHRRAHPPAGSGSSIRRAHGSRR